MKSQDDEQTWINNPLILLIMNLVTPFIIWENDMSQFGDIVIKGKSRCVAIYKKCLDKKNKKPEIGEIHNIIASDSSLSKQIVSIPTALCLIVPASVVGNLKNNHQINVSDIEELIDNASYFLCTSPEDADAIGKALELTDENIENVSEQKEVYIRINMTGAEEMIGKKVPYILKRNLPHDGQGDVTQLACLKYLSVSGLDKFNRI